MKLRDFKCVKELEVKKGKYISEKVFSENDFNLGLGILFIISLIR